MPRAQSRLSRALALAASLSLAIATARQAHAVVVERIVAVVGEQSILLSDLRRRARPVPTQIYDRVPPGAQRSAFESEMYKELLQQMVDERLMVIAAERAQKKATQEEVDNGLTNIAAGQGIKKEELIAAAIQSGLTEQELREQIHRQVLEQKMLSLRVVPRVKISPEDVRAGYLRLQREERKRLGMRQWVLLLVPPSASPEARAERRRLAEQLVAQARAGADFADLARNFSDDSESRVKGGDLGPQRPGSLAQPLEDVAILLDVGEISNPINYGQHIVILRIVERDASSLPALDQAQDRVAAEVFSERLQKARRQWLDELKKGVYVDVRLLS